MSLKWSLIEVVLTLYKRVSFEYFNSTCDYIVSGRWKDSHNIDQ